MTDLIGWLIDLQGFFQEGVGNQETSAPIELVYFPCFLGNYKRHTDQPTKQQTDMRIFKINYKK